MQKIHETERLILKIIDHTYLDLVLKYYLKNKLFLNEWEPTKDKDFFTTEFLIKQLKNDYIGFTNRSSIRFWIFTKKNNTMIGNLAFTNIIRGAFHSCYLGYKLDYNEVNKGYMTEALQKGIYIMFNQYMLHRIEANIMPKNKASLRVVEKLGFRNEGLAYRYLKINGQWEDHIHMVLLNENE
ncbi:MAG: GNAT family N-acetyltransferase [Eubacteriales bacterium]